MRRRTLLRTAPALVAPAIAGCTAAYGRIDVDAGQSHLHPAAERYVDGGLTADGDDVRAWLFTEPPDTDPIVADRDEGASLRDSLDAVDGSGFALLVEARMDDTAPYHLTPAHAIDPKWVRLADVTLPLARYRLDSDPGFAAEAVVVTALVTYEARTPPNGATVHVYDDDGAETPGSRFDARRVG
jgi:hypothetical protein